jgi:hypothetical protein
MPGPGTSVELHILTTHLRYGSHAVVGAEEWVELHSGGRGADGRQNMTGSSERR